MAVIDKISVRNTSYDIGANSDNVVYDSNNSVKDKIDEYEAIIPSSASSSNKLATATDIPTETSDLTNDSNFVSDANYVHTDNNYDATAKRIVDGVTSALALKANITDLPSAATSSALGLVKPDNSTITVDANGVISASADLSNYIEKSTTEGLVMNDGTIDTSKHVHLQPTHIEEFRAKTWNGLTSFDGTYIWTDGDNIYYSDNDTQYVLDKSTNTWNTKIWSGLTSFSGGNIWIDGNNIYYSYNGSNYILDKSTSTWSTKILNGLSSFDGQYIWTDGDNIYYSNDSEQYVLDKSTSTWNTKALNGLSNLYVLGIWTDKDNIYYSYNGTNCVLDKSTSTWTNKTWNSLPSPFVGSYVWSDGDNIYYSISFVGSIQYVLDKSTSTWIIKRWTGYTSINGVYIWTDGDNIYYSEGGAQYVFINETFYADGFVKSDGTIDNLSNYIQKSATEGLVKNDGTIDTSKHVHLQPTGSRLSGELQTKTWSGYSSIYGINIWTDGDNIYYSNGTNQYILDKATNTWNIKTWNGYSDIQGQYILTDGDNIYYSSSGTHYVLDKSTDTWSTKTWDGYSDFTGGDNIWTDGDNIYYSSISYQYILDKSTSTWNPKTWNGLTSFYGDYIWTDGINIYYSRNGSNYVLDKSTDTWNTKTWNGMSNFNGDDIWTDGDNIYYSNNFSSNNQYVLNKSTSTWNTKTLNGYSDISGSNTLTDGDNIYYSSGNGNQYVFVTEGTYADGFVKSDGTIDTNSYATTTALNDKVDKESGKGLSSNDYTTTEKSKLSGIAEGAEVNVQSDWNQTTDTADDYIKNKPTLGTASALDVATSGDASSTQVVKGDDTRLTDSRTPTAHNQASSTINAMTGYEKASTASAISTSDTLNQAIGKLEKAIENVDIPIATTSVAGKVKPDGTTITIDANGTISSSGGDLSNYIQKSTTEGLVKNDGTIDTSKHVSLQPSSELTGELQVKTWTGYTPYSSQYIWTDGDNIYYSNSSNQYVLDKSTNTWSTKTWNGMSSFSGNSIWTDGDNIYYSAGGGSHRILDKSTSTWSTKTWTGLTNFGGQYIWKDGDIIYYSYGTTQYVLDKSTSTWSTKTWTGLTNFDSTYIWTDGDNIYYSYSSDQYVLDKSTNTWSTKSWNGLSSFNGDRIWTDGTNIYYSYKSSQKVLDKSTSTWSSKTWTGLSSFRGDYIWTDGDNIYYSNSSDQYVFISEAVYADGFVKTDGTIDTNTYLTSVPTATSSALGLVKPDGTTITVDANGTISASADTSNCIQKSATEGLVKNDGTIDESAFVRLKLGLTGNLSTKTWNVNIQWSSKIWTDGDNTYYSYNNEQYVLDKSTGTWSTKIWNGNTGIYAGNAIWSDGDNVYYSNYNNQYVLDKSTSTWNTKTWNNPPSDFYGEYIWTDGTNIYYSDYNSNHYVLDKSTSTWNAKTWNGYTSFDAGSIWTDGDNIYCSNNSGNNYVLDKSTSTWNTKTWTGLSSFIGSQVWTDGTNIYYSGGGSSNQYVLDKSTSTWSAKTWTGLTSFYGSNLWTDGENIYYSNTSGNYVFDSVNKNTDGFVKSDGTIVSSPIAKTRYTITATNWSNSVDANGYYTYTISNLNPTLDTTYPPNVYLTGADDNTFYTDTEATQYSYLAQCNLTASTTLILYAKIKPDTTFYVFVEGQTS